MKALIAIAFALSTPAFAAQNTIYCEENGKVLNAFSEDGHFDCAGALRWGHACFTGDAQKVADKINNGEISWDEEWLGEAKVAGKDSIEYLWIDGPNEYKEEASMDRCTDDFFKK